MQWLAGRSPARRFTALAALAMGVGCNALSGVDDYQFGAGGSSATTTPTGSGGTAAAGGSTGGTGGSGGVSTGGTGGSGGGGGGRPPVLVDRGLVVRYYLDEATTGQGPTELEDAAPDPLDLAITYAPELAFVEESSQQGLHWTAVGSGGYARGGIVGTKVIAALDDGTTATIEAVVNVTAARTIGSSHIMAIGPGGNPGGLSLTVADPNEVWLYWHEGVQVGIWTVPYATAGRVVLHAVLDTAQPTTADRARLFVDGAAAVATGGTAPTLNELLDLAPDTTFAIGNGIGSTTLSLEGTIFYLAIYSSALSDAERANNLAVLQASDDSPP